MGSGNRGNFGKTKGSSIAEMVKKDYLVIKKKDLIKELEINNIKFNKKEMKFIMEIQVQVIYQIITIINILY